MTDGEDGRAAAFRHAWLLLTLVAVLFVRPFLGSVGSDVLEVLLVVALVAGAYASSVSPRARAALVLLAVTATAARVAWLVGDRADSGLLVVFLVAYTSFFTVVVGTLLQALLRDRARITFDTLCGAVSAYLVLGMVWSMLYALLEHVEPGSLVDAGGRPVGDAAFDRLLGFSFTTLTTLGYGNIAPATPRADALTSLEAIVGQIYVAVVIARLVALQITQHGHAADDGP